MFKGILAATAALTAAVATTASAAPLKGKPPTTGANCKPSIAVVLTGKLAAAGSSTLPFSLSVNVTGGNHAAAAYRKLTQPVTVTVTSTTVVNRAGDHSAAHLASGDRVNIQARACKADTTSQAPPALTAVRVTAHAAH
jgi:hypothetical protein